MFGQKLIQVSTGLDYILHFVKSMFGLGSYHWRFGFLPSTFANCIFYKVFPPHCSNGTKQSCNSSWAPKRQIFKCLKNPGMRIFYDWEIMLEKSYTPYVVLAFCKPDPPMREHQHCSVLHLRSNYPDSSGTCTQRTPEIGQRYTYRVLQTIQMKLIFLCVWLELAVLSSAKPL